MDCIKGKQIKHTKKCATRSTKLLEITHIDICGPFDTPYFGKEKYLITFIDDFSRYGYIYLLNEKSQAVNALEVYITEVEKQLKRKVKIIRSDRGGEYYVQAHLLNSLKSMAFVHNTLCHEHHSKMV